MENKKDRQKTRTGHIENVTKTRVRVINFVQVASGIIMIFLALLYVVDGQLYL